MLRVACWQQQQDGRRSSRSDNHRIRAGTTGPAVCLAVASGWKLSAAALCVRASVSVWRSPVLQRAPNTLLRPYYPEALQ